MFAKGSIRIWSALAFLTCLYFSTSSGLYSAEESHSACFDAEVDPSIRADACTQIIDTPETLELVRLSAYLNRAAANYHAGKLDNAIRDYSKFINTQPGNAIAFYERGLAYLKGLRYSEAIHDFSEAIRLNSKYASFYNNRGIAYEKAKKYDKALADFDVAIDLDPWSATALYNRSLTYFDKADYERAIVDLKNAIQIQPRNPELFNQLAWTYLEIGSAREGLQYANQSLALKPSANAYDTRGAIYEKIGDATQAADDYRHALILDPSSGRSDQALKRLLTNKEIGSGDVSALVAEVTRLVEEHGWHTDMGRMCAQMKLNSRSNCRFKQIMLSATAPNTRDDNGFIVLDDKDPQYVVIYHLEPLVGTFFVVSLDGTLKSSFFRAQGVDYTELPLSESRHSFNEAIHFWITHVDTIKGMIAAGDLQEIWK